MSVNEPPITTDTSFTHVALPKADSFIVNLLCEAAKHGDLRMLYRVSKEIPTLDARDDYGLTALHHACKNGDYEVVKFLVGNQADIFIKDTNQTSCLHFAAKADNPKIVRLLVILGADIKSMCSSGLKPIDFAPIDSETWHILYQASIGIMPNYGLLIEPLDVPFVPQFAIDRHKDSVANKDKKGKKGKKGGKGKKGKKR